MIRSLVCLSVALHAYFVVEQITWTVGEMLREIRNQYSEECKAEAQQLAAKKAFVSRKSSPASPMQPVDELKSQAGAGTQTVAPAGPSLPVFKIRPSSKAVEASISISSSAADEDIADHSIVDEIRKRRARQVFSFPPKFEIIMVNFAI